MQKPNSKSRILGLILSGGAGRRFSGADKGLQKYQGKMLISWVVQSLEQQADELIICINRNRREYEKLGHPTVFDQQTNHQGPIAGIMAAINSLKQTSRYEFVIISTCDTPLLASNFAEKLRARLSNSSAVAAVANDGHRNQNLHCLIRFSAIGSLAEFYAKGGRAMHRWYQQAGMVTVDFSDQADCFLNINTPQQLLT